jgi:hypothetical protein
MTLASFRGAFAGALLDPASSGPLASIVAQPGFAVYRNTVMKGCVDALVANYPAVVSVVGEAWFRAAAAVFVRAHPPRTPMLVEYGAGFAEFLRAFPPAAELPYLADVGRVDRFWTEAHLSPDEAPLRAEELARLAPEALAAMRLRQHASARWAWFDDAPIATLWRTNRRPSRNPSGADLEWRGEGVLVVRPHHAVVDVVLDAAGCAFLDACREGATLGEAAMAALAIASSADLSALLATLIEAGAFAAPQDTVTRRKPKEHVR